MSQYSDPDPRRPNQPSVDCELCGQKTRMTGTRRCDRCWELEGRVTDDPVLARKIVFGLAPGTLLHEQLRIEQIAAWMWDTYAGTSPPVRPNDEPRLFMNAAEFEKAVEHLVRGQLKDQKARKKRAG